MKTLVLLFVLQCIFLVEKGWSEESVEWESILPNSSVIEKLRINLPVPKSPLRRGALISMDGATVKMPNGGRAFYVHLGQIAEALVPEDRKGALILLSYLRDKDPHIRVLVALALELHLKDNGLGNGKYSSALLAQDLQERETAKALEDIVSRFSKLEEMKKEIEGRQKK